MTPREKSQDKEKILSLLLDFGYLLSLSCARLMLFIALGLAMDDQNYKPVTGVVLPERLLGSV